MKISILIFDKNIEKKCQQKYRNKFLPKISKKMLVEKLTKFVNENIDNKFL